MTEGIWLDRVVDDVETHQKTEKDGKETDNGLDLKWRMSIVF